MFKKIKFSWLELAKQFKDDLWCKEVATGYTVSYTWMANQLGHFALGFVPAIYFIWYIPVLLMAIKEFFDVKIEFNKSNGLYPVPKSDIVLNASTATYFTLVGALCAFNPLTLFVTIPTSLFVMKHWISQKKCFQQSGLPYVMRLNYVEKSRFDNPEHAKILIDKFMNNEIPKLVITGNKDSGKTMLATAIGTELGFNMVKCLYTTEQDMLTRKTVHLAFVLWSDPEVMIIDDCLNDSYEKGIIVLDNPNNVIDQSCTIYLKEV
jgi:hypothetical protein